MQIELTTTGRRTGKPRTVTLYAWEHDGSLIAVGSSGGAARDPAWVVNLRSHPRAIVTRNRDDVPVIARELDGAERARAWTVVVDRFPLYATYQGRTGRRIPLFRLAPADQP